MALLEVRNLSKHFGGLAAVDDLTFEVREREILGLIGPNGAGKTTVFNVISGVFPPTSGKVFFNGEDVTGLKPHKIAQKGIGRTFQNIALFKGMSVLNNIKLGAEGFLEYGIFSRLFVLRKSTPEGS